MLPPEIYRTRYQNLDTVRKRAGYDCFLIYDDRKHAGNLAWLTGFAPRFEGALDSGAIRGTSPHRGEHR